LEVYWGPSHFAVANNRALAAREYWRGLPLPPYPYPRRAIFQEPPPMPVKRSTRAPTCALLWAQVSLQSYPQLLTKLWMLWCNETAVM
jgi:hypothetical protein